jgi:hypothetical protein
MTSRIFKRYFVAPLPVAARWKPATGAAGEEAPARIVVYVAISFASKRGLRSGTRGIPVPNLSRVVTAEARASATKGSTNQL